MISRCAVRFVYLGERVFVEIVLTLRRSGAGCLVPIPLFKVSLY